MNVHGHSWDFMVKTWIFMVVHRESSMFMDFHEKMLRFNDVEIHRLPCEPIIGHQWQ